MASPNVVSVSVIECTDCGNYIVPGDPIGIIDSGTYNGLDAERNANFTSAGRGQFLCEDCTSLAVEVLRSLQSELVPRQPLPFGDLPVSYDDEQDSDREGTVENRVD